MKVGDKVPVSLAGHVVAQATVRELSDGTAVLVVPATAVTMAVRTELDAPPVPERETETIITGVDRPETASEATAPETSTPATVETPAETAAVETTTVEAPTETVVESPAVETPVETPAPVETREVQTTSVENNDTSS